MEVSKFKNIQLGKLTIISGINASEFNIDNIPKDVLVISFPEERIHPKYQVIAARTFAKTINARNPKRILIVTHSDYIVKEINTLIMLSNPGCEGIMEKYGYKKDELICHDDIRAYEIAINGEITKANISPELGIDMKSFDETIDAMNDIQEEIIFGEEGR